MSLHYLCLRASPACVMRYTLQHNNINDAARGRARTALDHSPNGFVVAHLGANHEAKQKTEYEVVCICTLPAGDVYPPGKSLLDRCN